MQNYKHYSKCMLLINITQYLTVYLYCNKDTLE